MDRDEYERMAKKEFDHWWYASTRELISQLLGSFDKRNLPPVILDAGCGTGATGAWLAEASELIALDIEQAALDHYQRRSPSARIIRSGVESMPLPDDSVDIVVCVTVLYHAEVAEPFDAISEFVRVLRPGGRVLLIEPGIKKLRRAHDRVTHTGRRFAREELRTLATEAGLRVDRLSGAYSFLVPIAFLKSIVERGTTKSDLDGGGNRIGWLLRALARLERRLMRHVSIPFGLSVCLVATKVDG